MLVTVPITNTLNIIVCLICETAFKHHRHALRHMRLHHQHYHIHHNGAAVGGVERKLWGCTSAQQAAAAAAALGQ